MHHAVTTRRSGSVPSSVSRLSVRTHSVDTQTRTQTRTHKIRLTDLLCAARDTRASYACAPSRARPIGSSEAHVRRRLGRSYCRIPWAVFSAPRASEGQLRAAALGSDYTSRARSERAQRELGARSAELALLGRSELTPPLKSAASSAAPCSSRTFWSYHIWSSHVGFVRPSSAWSTFSLILSEPTAQPDR